MEEPQPPEVPRRDADSFLLVADIAAVHIIYVDKQSIHVRMHAVANSKKNYSYTRLESFRIPRKVKEDIKVFRGLLGYIIN
jgi:hypothetical protein